MNGRAGNVNLQLDRALMRHDMSHINAIVTGTTVREEYTTHGLHLNSRGKMSLTHLTAESTYVMGMCQVGTIVFLLLPLLEPLLS
jgi:phage head maturation protease